MKLRHIKNGVLILGIGAALTELTSADEARIAALVKKAAA